MRKFAVMFAAVLLTSSLAVAATGRVKGGRAHVLPEWFKLSFLNIKEDAEEAGQSGKDLMIFFDLNNCPYCARVLDENFHGGENAAFIRAHFDVVSLNVQGDREVTWIDGQTFREAEIATRLRLFGTPMIVFVNGKGEQVFKLMGYRPPQTFRHALEYVHEKAYRTQTLPQFIEANDKKTVYAFRSHPKFENVTDFAGYQAPLLVIFEDRHCVDCASFHEKALNHPDVLSELKPFRVVRLDAESDAPIVGIDGRKTTPRAWATEIKVIYRPGVVAFDEGREVAHTDGRLYHFHMKEFLRYVSGKYYQRYDRFGLYLVDRQSELLKSGVNINFGE